MNEIYWMTVVGNLSTAFMVVWIVALIVIVIMLFTLLVTEGDIIEDEGGKHNFFKWLKRFFCLWCNSSDGEYFHSIDQRNASYLWCRWHD